MKKLSVIRCKLSFMFLRSALLCIRGSQSNHVLKAIDEFYLAFDNAGLWGVAWDIFPYSTFELSCILLFTRFLYIMVKLLT